MRTQKRKAGKSDLNESVLGENLFKNTGLIIKGLGRLPKEKRSELTAALGGLAEAGRATVLDKIPKIPLPGVEAKSREEAKERSGQN